jgi:hypothetical protein
MTPALKTAVKHVMNELLELDLVPNGQVTFEYTREFMKTVVRVNLTKPDGAYEDVFSSAKIWVPDNAPDDPGKWRDFARELLVTFNTKFTERQKR